MRRRAARTSTLRVILGNSSVVGYPEGGGHWTVFLQYLLGFRDLGHDVYWMELFYGAENREEEIARVAIFMERLRAFGVEDRAFVLAGAPGTPLDVDAMRCYGKSAAEVKELFRTSDALWNFAGAVPSPPSDLFSRRVLIDLDPGLYQLAMESWNMGQDDHDCFLTVGANIRGADCAVPAVGRSWTPFLPVVYLPMWPVTPGPDRTAPFTSVTQWTWGEIWPDPARSVSKRTAYLRYLSLPRTCGRPFELAANIHPLDETGDPELLATHGWRLVHPHHVAGSPEQYQRYIAASRAEFLCPKAIYRELRTGWLSDRSACYLASGRPVLAEDTGVPGEYPAGLGFVTFADAQGAAAGVADIDDNYPAHCAAARQFAEAFLDSRVALPKMLEACS